MLRLKRFAFSGAGSGRLHDPAGVNPALAVLCGGVAGLADRHAQGCRIQRHLGNECRTATGCGFDRASQGLAVTHHLIEIRCTIGYLGDGPVPDWSAESRYVHLAEELAEGGIGGRSLEFDAQCHCEHAVVTDGKTLQIAQVLATAQDSQNRHQQQIPGRNADPTPHPRIRDPPEKADQVEITCGKSGFGHGRGAIPPTSTHADSPSQGFCDTFKSALVQVVQKFTDCPAKLNADSLVMKS